MNVKLLLMLVTSTFLSMVHDNVHGLQIINISPITTRYRINRSIYFGISNVKMCGQDPTTASRRVLMLSTLTRQCGIDIAKICSRIYSFIINAARLAATIEDRLEVEASLSPSSLTLNVEPDAILWPLTTTGADNENDRNGESKQNTKSFSSSENISDPEAPTATISNNNTFVKNKGGLALDKNRHPPDFEAAENSILAIDPSTIDIVPTFHANNNVLVQNFLGNSTPATRDNLPNFVKMFRGSAQYIANHRNTIVVCHIPGELLEWNSFSDLIDDIALAWLLGMNIVLVVGCREQIDARLVRDTTKYELINSGIGKDHRQKGAHKTKLHGIPLNKTTITTTEAIELNSEIRITDIHTLRIVKEKAGYARFEVERQLARSLRLHGVNGAGDQDGNVVSGNFYSAQPYGVIDGVDYMYTGFPRRIEVDKIKQILEGRDVVLLTALGASSSGELFNVNSDFLAASTAGCLRASKLIYFTVHGNAFIVKGARQGAGFGGAFSSSSLSTSGKHVKNLRVSDARNLLKYHNVKIHNNKGFATIGSQHLSPVITEALLKVGWATLALDQGVNRAHIIAMSNGALLQELYTRDGSGTLISRDLYEGLRRANVNDVAGIYNLIEPLSKAGTLVDRPKNVLEKDISSYYVYTRDNHIVACAQLKRFKGGYAEIGCLVVSRDYRNQGRGDAMMGYLERLSVRCGCSTVFVLSTQTMEWFIERGFYEVGVDALPPSRKIMYNYKRRSKIYMKTFESDRDLDAAELWSNR